MIDRKSDEYMAIETYKDIIKINPLKRFARPCVRDTRISVYDVLA